MKKLLLLLVVAAAVYLGWRSWTSRQDELRLSRAEQRVEAMWSELQAGSTAAEQAAIAWWSAGRPAIASSEIGPQEAALQRFLRAKGINTVQSHTVDASRPHPSGDRVEVDCTVNGRRLTLLVADGQPLEWAP